MGKRLFVSAIALFGLAMLGAWQWKDCFWGPSLRFTYDTGDTGDTLVAFSPGGKTVVVGRGTTLRELDAGKGTQDLAFANNSYVTSLAFSADGRLLATGGEPCEWIHVWNRETGAVESILEGHTEPISAVAFTSAQKVLISGSSDDTVRSWDMRTGKIRGTFQVDRDKGIRSLCVSPDDRLIAAGGSNGLVVVLDLQTLTPRAQFHCHEGYVNCLAFSPDGKVLATGTNDGNLQLWSTNSWKELSALGNRHESVNSLAFTPDGKYLVAGCGSPQMIFQPPGFLEFWDVEGRKLRKSIHAHRSWVTSVSISPDGKLLATGSSDGTAKVWELPRK